MLVLAIDTAAGPCAACILDAATGEERAREVLDLGKGHAERLMAVIEAALAHAGLSYANLGGIAVSVGPGSFTGVRVGVAAARGLALALSIPAAGVSTLEALAAEARGTSGRPVIARIDAGRGQAYVASFDAKGAPLFGPAALALDEADTLAAGTEALLAEGRTADIAVYARLGAARLVDGAASPPRPLYLREADAKPQTAFALPRKKERP